jgi:hypothetical protein
MSNSKKSIIVFNGGSAGDFLKALCLEQLQPTNYNLTEFGQVVFHVEYFKSITKQHNTCTQHLLDIDLTKINDVDNTHYYFTWYDSFAKSYYIDYPDNMHSDIINLYFHKAHNNNINSFYDCHIKSVPDVFKSYATPNNILEISMISWRKNLKSWRNNSKLTKINLVDFFEINKMKSIVEQLCNCSINNTHLFLQSWQSWVDKNKSLEESLLK